jgi:hypothetical protein
VLIQRPVEELRAIIGVEVLHLKRSLCFELLELAQNGMAALVPNGAVFRPAAEELGER